LPRDVPDLIATSSQDGQSCCNRLRPDDIAISAIEPRRWLRDLVATQGLFVEQRTAPIERQGRLTEHKVTNLKF
jgi:hypothetical protein